MNEPRVIARCPKCYGEVLASGICPKCADPAESIEHLRQTMQARGKVRAVKAAQSELPPTDRE